MSYRSAQLARDIAPAVKSVLRAQYNAFDDGNDVQVDLVKDRARDLVYCCSSELYEQVLVE